MNFYWVESQLVRTQSFVEPQLEARKKCELLAQTHSSLKCSWSFCRMHSEGISNRLECMRFFSISCETVIAVPKETFKSFFALDQIRISFEFKIDDKLNDTHTRWKNWIRCTQSVAGKCETKPIRLNENETVRTVYFNKNSDRSDKSDKKVLPIIAWLHFQPQQSTRNSIVGTYCNLARCFEQIPEAIDAKGAEQFKFIAILPLAQQPIHTQLRGNSTLSSISNVFLCLQHKGERDTVE